MCISTHKSKILAALVLDICIYLVTGNNFRCPLWHVEMKGTCMCGAELRNIITCEGSHSISVIVGNCMTWDETTQRAVISRCPLPHKISDTLCPRNGVFETFQIPTNISGSKLTSTTCKEYNRQGMHCRQCRDGYGPAVFSDSFSCADCSKYTHLWVLSLFIQLIMVTLMYLVVILFQIKGTSSPLNVIFTYCQLFICPLTVSVGVRLRVVCYFGSTLTSAIFTVTGIWNLDFFRYIVPLLCVSASFKSVTILLFDYIVAFYPIVLTLVLYIIIDLHDRNCCIVVCITIPVKKFFSLFRTHWNPKTTILNTCITFILLAYSKVLFTSLNLLFAVRSYDSNGEVVPDSTILLYDPSIRFFHSEHIPYAIFALSVIVIFVLLPPLLLLLYPTKLFRKCLSCCGFRRWDILHLVADVFQGWYKDGTEGTLDYRALSALYLLLRVALGGVFLTEIYFNNKVGAWYIIGMCHIFIGTFFHIAKPYKKNWMNCIDGLIIVFIGELILINLYGNKTLFFFGVVFGSLILLIIIIVSSVYKCFKSLDHW